MRTTLLLATLLVATSGFAQSTATFIHEDSDQRVEVAISGDVTFSDDDARIVSMAPGSSFRVERTTGGDTEILRARPDGGSVDIDYRMNGRRTDPSEARGAIEALTAFAVRESGVNAPQRVKRLLAAGGTDAVFGDLMRIDAPGSVRRHLVALIEQRSLSETELRELLTVTRERIASSGDRGRLLIAVWPDVANQPATVPDFMDLADAIGSSGDRARVLLHVLDAGIAEVHLDDLLVVAAGIPSSGDQARVLLATIGHLDTNEKARSLLIDASANIPSSGDKARVLLATLGMPSLSEADLIHLLHASESIPSSGDRTRVLLEAAPQVQSDAAVNAYLKAAESIRSSGDKARVLESLMVNG